MKESKTISLLLESCEEYVRIISKDKIWLPTIYKKGEALASTISYTKHDIEVLSRKITIPQRPEDPYFYTIEEYLGFYISALTNKIITENDRITLKPKVRLAGLGSYLKKGNITIEGNVLEYVGHCVSGGRVIVNGNARRNAGVGISGGEVIVNGNAGSDAGGHITGGLVRIIGDAESWVGCMIKGGKVIVRNAGSFTGWHMQGGDIIVEEDADGWTGDSMRSGRIFVGGNAGIQTGENMKGGEIIVHGEIASLADNYNGKIYNFGLNKLLSWYRENTELFIESFSIISTDKKKIILDRILNYDFTNDKVVKWLDEHEPDLIRDVGLSP